LLDKGVCAVDKIDSEKPAAVIQDAVRRARDYLRAGHPDEAIRLLNEFPDDFLTHDGERPVASEKLLACAMSIRAMGMRDRPDVLYMAFRCFCIATMANPLDVDAYQCMAACWGAVGDYALAERVLQSIHHSHPDPSIAQALAAFPKQRAHCPSPQPSAWSGDYQPRIFLLTMPDSDYQFDSIYDAFCRLLGPEKIVEYPWKGVLHGGDSAATCGYPCASNWPGEPQSVEALAAQLRAGEFDLFVYADRMERTDIDDVRCLVDAARDVPFVIMDTWDDGVDAQEYLLERVGRGSCLAYFKRERVRSLLYQENTFPFPFGYPDSRVPEALPHARPDPIFWTGKRLFGMRPLQLDFLERRKLIPMLEPMGQNEYKAALQRARIGLSLCGFGFDTVRYWEVTAHGAMLLAEKPAIGIPNDFVDGESAVFFNDLGELEEKLNHYLIHEEEATTIAAAGHAHFKQHHTTSVRARQFLGQVEACLNE
jgi:hypothetical protein